jgi:hypothetical protein
VALGEGATLPLALAELATDELLKAVTEDAVLPDALDEEQKDEEWLLNALRELDADPDSLLDDVPLPDF